MQPPDQQDVIGELWGGVMRSLGEPVKILIVAVLGGFSATFATVIAGMVGIDVGTDSHYGIPLALLVIGGAIGLTTGAALGTRLSSAAERYRYVRLYNRTRAEWPPEKSFLYSGCGRYSLSSKEISVRLHIQNGGHVEWVISKARLPRVAFISSQIGAITDFVEKFPGNVAEIIIDQGEQSTIHFSCTANEMKRLVVGDCFLAVVGQRESPHLVVHTRGETDFRPVNVDQLSICVEVVP